MARNGSDANTSASSCQTKGDLLSPRKAAVANEVVPKSNDSEVKENGVSEDLHSTQWSLEIHSNGAFTHSSGNGLIVDCRVKDFSVESQEDSLHSFLPGDSEEEEAAFMQSLGWEENAEGSELTEEEINAFYQMRERKQLLNSGGGNYNFRALGVDHFVGSVGSMSSGFSSSYLEIDEAPSSLLGRALSNNAH